MHRLWLAASGFLGIAIAVACSSKMSTPLPCNVATVLANRCQQCHQDPPLFGSPMPLVTWEDLHAPAKTDGTKKVYELVGTRIHDDKAPMPQPPNARLSPDDTAVLDAWVAQGAPAATTGDQCASSGDAGNDATDDGTALPQCDTHLAPTAPFTMPLVNDEYTCYAVDLSPPQKEHVITITPHIDNKQIVHHVLLFQSPNATAFGTTATKCSAFGNLGWSFVYAWAPGGATLNLPPEAGYPIEGTTHYIVQVHYNNIQMLSGQTDSTGIDFCTTTQLRPNDADVVGFGTTTITVPAHGTLDVTCNSQVGSSLDGTHVIATMPHMHKIGTAISATQLPAQLDLGTEVPFNFNGQGWLPKTATLAATDTISTRCAWQNPGDLPVTFGENTEDEMCFVFTMYYPKRPLLSWLQYAYTSTCSPTP